MAVSGSLQLTLELGICRNHGRSKRLRVNVRLFVCAVNIPLFFERIRFSSDYFLIYVAFPDAEFSKRQIVYIEQYSAVNFTGPSLDANIVKNATLTLARSFNRLQGSPIVIKLASAVGILIFAVWGLGPLVRLSRNIFLQERLW
ncbi:hypothetical protein Sango_1866700 [Sesamum angolense]|uniref:Uncharacterized protein n=1 Tax=Sesamum angolense TaxID=2727404 RepID=A0AAE1WIR1_9LAMI|nr:hypothetical protein Sango_1866700 [Sesamum angolense]